MMATRLGSWSVECGAKLRRGIWIRTSGRKLTTIRRTRLVAQGCQRNEHHLETVMERSEKMDVKSDRGEEFQIVNLYHLVPIAHPDQVVMKHKEWIKGRDIRGRIYFSSQGVNAQFSGTVLDTMEYVQWMREQPWFKDLRWNCDPVEQHMFPKLRLQHKANLVQLSGGMSSLPITKPEERAVPLKPDAWKAKLTEALSPEKDTAKIKPVVLDVRNGYEWDAGHFEGAQRPREDSFCETPTAQEVPEPLRNADKDTPVLMYCTGGIRCDIYSTVLRKNGFRDLYSLEGGVQQYFKEEGGELWDGSLFVFDGRMAIHPQYADGAARELPSSVQCQVCQGPGKVPHVNCANVDCNRLFVACESCKTRLRGCCCEECMDAPRLLRPALLEGGFYGKFGTYAMGRLKRSVAAATQRQLEKRERRLGRVKQRRQAAKNVRLELKKAMRKMEEAREESSNGLTEALAAMRNSHA